MWHEKKLILPKGNEFEEKRRVLLVVKYGIDTQFAKANKQTAYFSITISIYKSGADRWMDSEKNGGELWSMISGGSDHETIAKYFPDLAPLIQFHLWDGLPMYYIENSMFHLKNTSHHVFLDYIGHGLCASDKNMWKILWRYTANDTNNWWLIEYWLKERQWELMQAYYKTMKQFGIM